MRPRGDAHEIAGAEDGSMMEPLLTASVHERLLAAVRAGASTVECSLDLERSRVTVGVGADGWTWAGRRYPYLQKGNERTVYYWSGHAFEPAARFSRSLVKLVPTEWGAPTFEIDGIKMLPTSEVSPFADAERKVALIQPRGKRILDTCGGLGYFAHWCLSGHASEVLSCEKNPDVLWLRSLNPWSPQSAPNLTLIEGDITEHIAILPADSVDAILHDPPRFGIAGELYSFAFYEQLARVLRRKGRMFHYTGAPNQLTSGRDVRNEVATRLQRAGFATHLDPDGVLAVRK
jgi:predicted methyltransferase